MPSRMIRCSGAKGETRCAHYVQVVAPKGVPTDYVYLCTGCDSGQPPYQPRDSARKGQQKSQPTGKKKK